MEVPEAAREFVKKAAGTAKERAAEIHAGSEKVTMAIETAVAGSVSETAKICRNIPQAVYQDAEALFAGIDKLASAKSLTEAVPIQAEMVRARANCRDGPRQGNHRILRQADRRRCEDRAGQLLEGRGFRRNYLRPTSQIRRYQRPASSGPLFAASLGSFDGGAGGSARMQCRLTGNVREHFRAEVRKPV